MKAKKEIIILIVIAIFCLSIPFGGDILSKIIYHKEVKGTDDIGCDIIRERCPNYNPKPLIHTFEPTEKEEPWLFTGQILIGVLIFGGAYWWLIKKSKQKKEDKTEDNK